MNLEKSLGVCDWLILLTDVLPKDDVKKINKHSYPPQHVNLKYFEGWEELLSNAHSNLIDPTLDVIKQIKQAERLFIEAMHGIIAIDSLRVPRGPIVTSKTINTFKWKDYCDAIGEYYKSCYVSTLFDKSFLKGIGRNKIGREIAILNNLIPSVYSFCQKNFIEKKEQQQLCLILDKMRLFKLIL